MKTRITVVGSLNIDLVIRSEHIPLPGETITGRDFKTIPGGKGANQAVAAARQGAEVNLVGRIGKDSFAELLLENLAESGVNVSNVLFDPVSATGVALIVVDDAGENSIVVAPGANICLDEAQVDAAAELIAGSEVLVLQLEIPLQPVIHAAQIARDHGVKVILNPAPARELPEELFKLVDVLIPNETETAILSGQKCEKLADYELAAGKLLDLGAGSVVITLGKHGSLLTDREHKSLQIRAFKVNPVDTTAAGDAFVASLAVHLGSGHSLPDAIRWGNAAGALATMRFGAQTSLPNQDEVARLIGGEYPDQIIRKDG